MERSRKVFLKIASAANKVVTTANDYADREDRCGVKHSHFQLECDMRRISVTCECIANSLAKSFLSDGGPEFDVRLQDWLETDGPQQCLDTLIRMEGLLRKDESSWASWIFRREWITVPAEDRIKEAAEHFSSRKAYFHFLFSTEIWNNQKNVQRQKGHTVQRESDALERGSSVAIQTEISSTVPDQAIHEGGHANHIIQKPEGTNVRPEQNPMVPLQNAIPDTVVHLCGHIIGKTGQETVFNEQAMKEVDAKKLDEIVKWLDGLNCAEKQDDTLALRQPNTCKWLLDTAQYKMWRDGGNSCLWLRGKPGAGKSVLASSVIDSVGTSLRKGESHAFFYCDFRSQRSTSSVEVLRSILCQLLRGSCDSIVNPGTLLDELVKAKQRGGSTRNNSKALAVFASRVAALSSEKPLVVIDALDECKDVKVLLQALMVIKSHVRLFVTSQPLHVIMRGLSGLPFISMDDMENELSADIELHVIRELDARHRLRDIDAGFKAEIRSVLCKQAGGMFRWIQCSIDTLDRCWTRKEVRRALKSLPEGLDESYERTLLALGAMRREGWLARRALTWLVVALRPLRLSELIEGLSINLQTRSLDDDFGPMHNGALLDACGSLVTYNEKTGVIILSHFSVKEYLMGKLVLTQLPQYHINRERAHLQLARSCLCYLSICLNSPLVSSSSILAHIPATSERMDRVVSQSLRDYMFDDAVDHFRHLGSQFQCVLQDIKALARDIQQHSRMWNNLSRSARRDVGSATPSWPTSKHDFTLYMLVAYAPNSLLQKFLRHTLLKPKECINPLVYAAYFNKEEHARTLLSRGGRLNYRGWDVDGSFQVLPIEVALQACHYAMVTLFVKEGCIIPSHTFTNTFSSPYQPYTPASIARLLLQTDDFAEAANDPLNEVASQPADIFHCLLEAVGTRERDLIEILRRFIQVAGNDILRSFFYTLGHRWRRMTALIIQFLVENGVNIHTTAGNPVLHTALQSSREEDNALKTVKVLIGHGCDPLEASSSGETPLHIAVKRGLVSVARYLLSLDISPSPDLLHTASELADEQKRVPMIICLIENGANVREALTAAGDSVLHTALQSSWDEYYALEVAKVLVCHGCDPLNANPFRKTPLQIAVGRGLVSVARYLLSLGISPSPDLLHVALESYAYENIASMIVCLLKNGANVHARTAAGDPVLHIALQSLWDDVYALETAKTLISHGCDPREASSSGKTPLQIAVGSGLVSVVRYLLSLGISPSPDLLHVALGSYAHENIASMIVCLLENGTNVHARTAAGDSVLHAALKSLWNDDYALEATKVLVGHGCDPFEASSSGENPLYIAVQRGFVSVARYLLSLGIFPSPNLLLTALKLEDEQKRALMIICLAENRADVHAHITAGGPVLHTVLHSLRDETYALEVAQALVNHGCDPLELGSSGETPLYIAVQRGFVSVTRYLLSLGISPSPDLLHVATESHVKDNIASMIICLLEDGANVHTRTAAGGTVLHAVLRSSWDEDYALEVAKALVNHGCNPLEASATRGTPLHIAVGRGLVSVARYFLSLGMPPFPDLLHIASSLQNQWKRVPMVICLVENGANVRARTVAGDPVLHTALKAPLDSEEVYALEVAKVLICHGCDPLEASSSGKTPLHIAIERGFVSVARYLLSFGFSGVNPLEPNTHGEASLCVAIEQERFVLARILLSLCAPSSPCDVLGIVLQSKQIRRKLQTVDFLINNGANVLEKAKNEDSVLHVAIASVSFDEVLQVVALLIRQGCDPTIPNPRGATPFHVAVERGCLSVVEFFLWLNIPLPPNILFTAIQPSSTFGSSTLNLKLKIAKVLVTAGCHTQIRNAAGLTPLDVAYSVGRLDVVDYLLTAPVPPDVSEE
ncbi:ankyrin repeat-containing domain protein [Boletus edulis]|nr:ankyrin repeat-containing domain protein [Boletus edulis]